jgi:hypothetical protein
MKKIYLLIIISVFSLQNRAQVLPSNYPYPDAEWTYLQRWEDWFAPNPPLVYHTFYTVKVAGDSIWNNKQYHKVCDAANPTDFMYYRKSNDSLYSNIFSQSNPNDLLEYNFAANVGQMVNQFAGPVTQAWSASLLNGQTARYLTYTSFGQTDTVIENIGEVNTPWYNYAFTTVSPVWTRLVCFKNADTVLYYVPATVTDTFGTHVNPCAALITNAGEQKILTDVFVFADASSGLISIRNNSGASFLYFELYDGLGRRVSSRNFSAKNETFSFPGFSPGVYFYTLHDGERKLSGKLFIR